MVERPYWIPEACEAGGYSVWISEVDQICEWFLDAVLESFPAHFMEARVAFDDGLGPEEFFKDRFLVDLEMEIGTKTLYEHIGKMVRFGREWV